MPRFSRPGHRVRGLLILVMGACAGLVLQACHGVRQAPAVEASLKGPVPAFRSVLDGQPRMLTVRVNNELPVPYNTESGRLYKACEGDTELQRAESDQRQAPQPRGDGSGCWGLS